MLVPIMLSVLSFSVYCAFSVVRLLRKNFLVVLCCVVLCCSVVESLHGEAGFNLEFVGPKDSRIRGSNHTPAVIFQMRPSGVR
jgi:hypothetical protein